MNYSDYIVYVDESGDHSLHHINPVYPVFVLAFCLIRKQDYLNLVVPEIQALKFRYFGHDMVILHEAEIRKAHGPFNILLNSQVRSAFLDDLSGIIEKAPFTLVASCIDKQAFVQKRGSDGNPYHVAMEFGLEHVYQELEQRGQRGKTTHVIFEQRGFQEDCALELEFRRICDQSHVQGLGGSLDIVLASKKTNSAGLQLADMVARPIGRRLLDKHKRNRAFDILEKKFMRGPNGEIKGWGLKVYP